MPLSKTDFLDAVVVGTPVGDAFLDGLGLEILREGLVDEGGEFLVGGEAQGDELPDGELLDVGEFAGPEKRLKAETLFEADDAVLELEVVDAALGSEDEKGDREDDPPDGDMRVGGPMADGVPNGEDYVEHGDGKDEEVDEWVHAAMVLQVLFGRHRLSFW